MRKKHRNMITKIQGIFKPEILVDYKTIRSPGKNIGEQGNLTLKVWGGALPACGSRLNLYFC